MRKEAEEATKRLNRQEKESAENERARIQDEKKKAETMMNRFLKLNSKDTYTSKEFHNERRKGRGAISKMNIAMERIQ